MFDLKTFTSTDEFGDAILDVIGFVTVLVIFSLAGAIVAFLIHAPYDLFVLGALMATWGVMWCADCFGDGKSLNAIFVLIVATILAFLYFHK